VSVRVVVTGLGPVCALGSEPGAFWEALTRGESGVVRLPALAEAPVDFGAPVEGIEASRRLSGKERRLDRVTQLALAAAAGALEDAGLAGAVGEDAGVVLGSSRGATGLLEAAHERYLERGAAGVGPHVSPYTTAGNLSGAVALRFGLRGPSLSVSAACSSAAQAIGSAFDAIRHGRAEVMLAGGAEACLTPFCVSMFAATGILSRRAGDPKKASRPFDRDRDGIVLGEGAGVIVLEAESHARRRGARVYAELCGFGATCDAGSLTGVPRSGEGLVRAMRAALADAGIGVGAIDYVNAHGTATVAGDRAEAAALAEVLGERRTRVPVSSTKGSKRSHAFWLSSTAWCRPPSTWRTPTPSPSSTTSPSGPGRWTRRSCSRRRWASAATTRAWSWGGDRVTATTRRPPARR
jgi:3-oxoacyl-[acyl-carrier-protein] synthase II